MSAKKPAKPVKPVKAKPKAGTSKGEQKKKPGAKPLAKELLEKIGIDSVCGKIMDGMSMTDIAGEAGVSFGTLQAWLDGNPEYSARAREARAATAKYWDDKATREIELAQDPFGLAKAKELAHHYRWRASKIAPREYGERTTLAGDPENPVALLTMEQITTNPNSRIKVK